MKSKQKFSGEQVFFTFFALKRSELKINFFIQNSIVSQVNIGMSSKVNSGMYFQRNFKAGQ